ncbi:uroporphyrinogen-III synthase [Spiribacter halobius]|uniref:Uroporphyrinogen-III synthase n=1 Tax=Sediminicurvatus halobius TaxID=2182432 RepID=A0A2U2N2U5_9GAMM|nr:uroporphyrinogen-III synthase [Spiribacter halobius]PWG63402.1 uroporphyrinogen III synthase [Spiribacter halobius]UEX78071.1 uroporphyrinogen-III synthase [Spiribacter halobius]
MSRPLAGCHVVVTRPEGQQAGLCRELETLGARVTPFPTVAFESLAPGTVPAADWAVFTSPNAVRYGLPWLARLPSRVAAVGPGTAAALAAAGCPVTVAPARGGGADDLLAEPGFAPAPGETVLVLRGEGGRRRLQAALAARGVRVGEAVVYRRVLPPAPAAPDWQDRERAFTIVTSVTGLENLLRLTDEGARPLLMASRVVAVSARVAAAARAAGFSEPVLAEGADDAAVVAAVVGAATGSER